MSEQIRLVHAPAASCRHLANRAYVPARRSADRLASIARPVRLHGNRQPGTLASVVPIAGFRTYASRISCARTAHPTVILIVFLAFTSRVGWFSKCLLVSVALALSAAAAILSNKEKEMRIRVSTRLLGAVMVLVASIIAPANADEWNKETRIEINEPLEVPGKVLTPGKYVFKIADSPSDRNIVQIFSEDADGNQKLVTTVLAISAYRPATPEKPIIQVEERQSGSTQAIHRWFHPGDNIGWEFVYPKAERLEVAASQAPPAEPAFPPVTVPDPPVPVIAPPVETPLPQQLLVAQNEKPVPTEESAERQPSPEVVLPQTAGHSVSELTAGATMFGLGLLTLLIGFRGKHA